VFAVISPFSFLILLIWVFSLLILVRFVRGCQCCLFYKKKKKKKLFVSLTLFFFFFFFGLFFTDFTQIFIISLLLLVKGMGRQRGESGERRRQGKGRKNSWGGRGKRGKRAKQVDIWTERKREIGNTGL
jgi:hypothetical protein